MKYVVVTDYTKKVAPRYLLAADDAGFSFFFSYFICPTVTMLETNVVSYRLFYISVYRKLLHNKAMILDFSLE
jgi:hypothetical protein